MEPFVLVNLNPIPVSVPEQAVLTRLGGNRHRTAVTPEDMARYRRWMQEARSVMSPRGRYAVVPIRSNDGTAALVQDAWRLESAALCKLLRGASHLWVGAITVGKELTELVESCGDDLTRAVVFDAAGSECADSAMDFLQQQAARTLLRQGKILGSRRFSPGYGGWKLENQKEIFGRLRLAELGMTYTATYIMQPEKSVTAVAPVFPSDAVQ